MVCWAHFRISFEIHAYDLAGRITQQGLPNGRVIGYQYDGNGNVTAITPPGRPDHNYFFTPVDLVSDYALPDVGEGTNVTHYTYNVDQQLTQVQRPDGLVIGLTYDTAGRLETLSTPRGDLNYLYVNVANGQIAQRCRLCHRLLNSVMITGSLGTRKDMEMHSC